MCKAFLLTKSNVPTLAYPGRIEWLDKLAIAQGTST